MTVKGNDSMRVPKKERRKYNAIKKDIRCNIKRTSREIINAGVRVTNSSLIRREYWKPQTKLRYREHVRYAKKNGYSEPFMDYVSYRYNFDTEAFVIDYSLMQKYRYRHHIDDDRVLYSKPARVTVLNPNGSKCEYMAKPNRSNLNVICQNYK